MNLKELSNAVQELLELGKLRAELERAPNGNIKDKLKLQIEEELNRIDHFGNDLPSNGKISIKPSFDSAFKGVYVITVSDTYRLLLRLTGPYPEISLDFRAKSPETCAWIDENPKKRDYTEPFK